MSLIPPIVESALATITLDNLDFFPSSLFHRPAIASRRPVSNEALKRAIGN